MGVVVIARIVAILVVAIVATIATIVELVIIAIAKVVFVILVVVLFVPVDVSSCLLPPLPRTFSRMSSQCALACRVGRQASTHQPTWGGPRDLTCAPTCRKVRLICPAMQLGPHCIHSCRNWQNIERKRCEHWCFPSERRSASKNIRQWSTSAIGFVSWSRGSSKTPAASAALHHWTKAVSDTPHRCAA